MGICRVEKRCHWRAKPAGARPKFSCRAFRPWESDVGAGPARSKSNRRGACNSRPRGECRCISVWRRLTSVTNISFLNRNACQLGVKANHTWLAILTKEITRNAFCCVDAAALRSFKSSGFRKLAGNTASISAYCVSPVTIALFNACYRSGEKSHKEKKDVFASRAVSQC